MLSPGVFLGVIVGLLWTVWRIVRPHRRACGTYQHYWVVEQMRRGHWHRVGVVNDSYTAIHLGLALPADFRIVSELVEIHN